ncbi:GNAT family N-acetyltransferase [Algoriphagus pacificus]|uniref:GNAT family N-acetyltransferase n=1 Tax=Algoriphagus pacificus TaxID=2811234 RepID=A0ABS3CFL3_9BACT|nr:GNAT family N-acetyltransferase [Algoriphagus pacificus]MBN7815822.1 GNAT family N-acetyltransferase [Algoriphagus pacificus]
MIQIRPADNKNDLDGIWEIFSKVIQTGDTYVFDPKTPKEKLSDLWFASSMDTFVLENESGKIAATYFIKPNQIDLGNHIANCGYMVHPDEQGNGYGSMLCEHSIQFAKQKGYLGIQFNIVISTNHAAIHLWKKHGFEIIGTTPKGFRHSQLGFVDTFVMFLNLKS